MSVLFTLPVYRHLFVPYGHSFFSLPRVLPLAAHSILFCSGFFEAVPEFIKVFLELFRDILRAFEAVLQVSEVVLKPFKAVLEFFKPFRNAQPLHHR